MTDSVVSACNDRTAQMAIYVGPLMRMRGDADDDETWCRLMADTQTELEIIRRKIPITRSYVQHVGTADEYYPLTAMQRRKARMYGAGEVTLAEIARILERKRAKQPESQACRWMPKRGDR